MCHTHTRQYKYLTYLMHKFPNKMIVQVLLNGYFIRKSSFAGTGIRTHDLPTHVFLFGEHLPDRDLLQSISLPLLVDRIQGTQQRSRKPHPIKQVRNGFTNRIELLEQPKVSDQSISLKLVFIINQLAFLCGSSEIRTQDATLANALRSLASPKAPPPPTDNVLINFEQMDCLQAPTSTNSNSKRLSLKYDLGSGSYKSGAST